MLTRSFFSILIVAASIVLVNAQTPDAKSAAAKPTRPTIQRTADGSMELPFPQGIDLQFLIRELAREMDLNVLFDPESFRSAGRKTNIDLKNVTAADALNYVLLQERLYSEEVGPKTIIVSLNTHVNLSIPYFGANLLPLSDQLAQYFGVKHGVLVTNVREDSPSSKAGLKAGDLITTIDDKPFLTASRVVRNHIDKAEGDVILKIMRDKQELTISLTRDNGIK